MTLRIRINLRKAMELCVTNDHFKVCHTALLTLRIFGSPFKKSCILES